MRYVSLALAVLALMLVQANASATVITDNGTPVFFDNYEGVSSVSHTNGPDSSGLYSPVAVIGTWGGPASPAYSTQVTNSTTSPDPGAYSGSQYLRIYRGPNPPNNTTGVACGYMTTAPALGDTVTVSTMVYIPSSSDANARFNMELETVSAGSGEQLGYSANNRAYLRTNGAGGVIDYTSSALSTGLSYSSNVWQKWSLSYVVGATTFSATVNGVTATGLTAASAGTLNNGAYIGGIFFTNGAVSGEYYLDSQSVTVSPEPSTLVLLACGLISLLAYAWRKRR